MKRNKIRLQISRIKKFDLSQYSDFQLLDMSRNLASSLSENNSVFLERSFALVCEVISRTLHIIPYDVQIEAGLSMVNEDIVELPTGEGKTIVALFPAYIKVLGKKGVHIFTFNDFLAKRVACG